MRISDWSSDVCSSDLIDLLRTGGGEFDPLIDRGMYLEIDEIPTDIHHAQLLRALQPFMPLVAGIFVTIDPTSPKLQRFDGLGSKLLGFAVDGSRLHTRSEEHTSELQSLMRISYAVFCLKKKKT